MKALVNTCIQAHHLWTLLLVYELKMWSVTVSLHMSFAISTVCLFCKLMCFRVAHSCSVTCTCTNDKCCCLHQLITDDRESKNRLKWRSLIRVWINMCDSVTLSPLSNQAIEKWCLPRTPKSIEQASKLTWQPPWAQNATSLVFVTSLR